MSAPLIAGEIIQAALADGRDTLSELEALEVLAAYGVPICRAEAAADAETAVRAADAIGYPVVLKGVVAGLAHKTEMGLVAVGLETADEVRDAAARFHAAMPAGGTLLVQEMVSGAREFLLGMTRDPQFGACVSFGLGGVMAEALNDVALALSPVSAVDARAMLDRIRARALLEVWRGMPAVDVDTLVAAIVGLGRLAADHPEVAEVDVNPLVVTGARPVAVDALVVMRRP